MDSKIGVHLIFGSNPEPFLEAALESVQWADYVCAVNTAQEDGVAYQNEQAVRRVVPREKLRMKRMNMGRGASFDFGKARNECLDLADDNDYVLILDSDDVHYPELEGLARWCVMRNFDMVTAHFWHLIGYKDLWGQEPHREILFTKDRARFNKGVHEGIDHPREHPALLPDYHYVHYGYIKPPKEIFKRWVLYSQIEGDPDHYNGQSPDDAIAGWLENTQPFWRDHPPAVQKLLESYPPAPKSVRAIEAQCNIGLVMLTWNDAENLKNCLKTLALTRQTFELVMVDNGSTDNTNQLVREFAEQRPNAYTLQYMNEGKPQSLATALNRGFQHFMDRDDIDYIGWIHPDMIFERDTWLECLRHCLDTHPDVVKVGAWEMDTAPLSEPTAANSQCYLIRKSTLQRVGLFDERFEACGGYEDWEHNHRLLEEGRVMVWPDAKIRHKAMGTRRNHDNVEAGRRNAEIYHSIVGQWDAFV